MTSRFSWHGGGLAAARAHFGDGGQPWLDLSTGINPNRWPGAAALPIDWRRLPEESDLAALEATAAAHFGTAPAHVCALPGTEIGLRLIGGLLEEDAPYCLAPTYRTHREIAPHVRILPLAEMAGADGHTLILANPNNPDGRLLDRPAMLDILARRGDGGWLIVDEAFADCCPQTSVAGHIGDDARLIVLRSFGKFFGLAGLRLGFMLGPREVVASLRQKLGAWPVSAAAIAIGRPAYGDAEWIAATRLRLADQAAALDAVLAAACLSAIGSCPLFRLIVSDEAPRLFDRLARQAILTRPFEDNPRWLRIGLPEDAAALARLEAALRHG